MPGFQDHPTVRAVKQATSTGTSAPASLDIDDVRRLVLAAGADDMGIVALIGPNWMISGTISWLLFPLPAR